MTALANQVLTAAQYNAYVRDNLLEMATAKATAAGQHFAVTAVNSIANRQVKAATVLTSENTSSTSYTNLATAGPSVTVDCGENCLVMICSSLYNNTASSQSCVSVEMSGTDSEAANDNWRLNTDGTAATQPVRYMAMRRYNFLVPGTHTFTMKYRVGSGTGSFDNRTIIALPI